MSFFEKPKAEPIQDYIRRMPKLYWDVDRDCLSKASQYINFPPGRDYTVCDCQKKRGLTPKQITNAFEEAAKAEKVVTLKIHVVGYENDHPWRACTQEHIAAIVQGIQNLGKTVKRCWLQVLDLTSSAIPHEGLSQIAKAILENPKLEIKILGLWGNHPTQATFKALKPLAQQGTLVVGLGGGMSHYNITPTDPEYEKLQNLALKYNAAIKKEPVSSSHTCSNSILSLCTGGEEEKPQPQQEKNSGTAKVDSHTADDSKHALTCTML